MSGHTPQQLYRLAEWHASRALIQEQAGKPQDARESMESAIEWLTMAGIPCGRVTDPTEIHGLCARARTGVLE